MKKRFSKAAGMLAIVMVFASCELTDLPTTEDLENAQGSLIENTNAELSVLKVFENVNNLGFNSNETKSALLNGPTHSWSNLVLTIDFTNVPGASGKIIADFSAQPAYTQGLSVGITLEDYVDNGLGMSGSLVLEVNQFVAEQMVKFSIVSNGNLTISEAGAASYLWSCDETIEWFQGVATLVDGSDDAFKLNGTAMQVIDTLTNKLTFADVIYSSSCEYIMDGDLTLVHDYGSDSELEILCNFGVDASGNDTGACDKFVEMSTGGITLSVEMD